MVNKTAREIAEERLAKGEIDQETFESIVKNFDSAIQNNRSNEQEIDIQTSETSKAAYWLSLIPIVTILGYRFFSQDGSSNLLEVFEPYDGFVSFALIILTFYGLYGIFMRK